MAYRSSSPNILICLWRIQQVFNRLCTVHSHGNKQWCVAILTREKSNHIISFWSKLRKKNIFVLLLLRLSNSYEGNFLYKKYVQRYIYKFWGVSLLKLRYSKYDDRFMTSLHRISALHPPSLISHKLCMERPWRTKQDTPLLTPRTFQTTSLRTWKSI